MCIEIQKNKNLGERSFNNKKFLFREEDNRPPSLNSSIIFLVPSPQPSPRTTFHLHLQFRFFIALFTGEVIYEYYHNGAQMPASEMPYGGCVYDASETTTTTGNNTEIISEKTTTDNTSTTDGEEEEDTSAAAITSSEATADDKPSSTIQQRRVRSVAG